MKRFLQRGARQAQFLDRIDAGEQLGERLASVADGSALVLGLPRGGVPVAAEVARALGAELDVVVARKVGAPHQPELAVGAVTADGGVYLDARLVEQLGIPPGLLEELIAREREVARQREERFRGHRPYPDLHDRTVILVDNGLATGATMHAAVHAIRKRRPGRLIVAVPVGSASACASLAEVADEVICLHTPPGFHAVGLHYADFTPTRDEEVERLLREFRDAEGDPNLAG